MSSIEWSAFLAILYILCQDEIDLAVSLLILRLFVVYANAHLLIQSYLIYRKLKKGIEANGFKIPPFKFTPIDR
jgi:hypothetical protein